MSAKIAAVFCLSFSPETKSLTKHEAAAVVLLFSINPYWFG